MLVPVKFNACILSWCATHARGNWLPSPSVKHAKRAGARAEGEVPIGQRLRPQRSRAKCTVSATSRFRLPSFALEDLIRAGASGGEDTHGPALVLPGLRPCHTDCSLSLCLVVIGEFHLI